MLTELAWPFQLGWAEGLEQAGGLRVPSFTHFQPGQGSLPQYSVLFHILLKGMEAWGIRMGSLARVRWHFEPD